ncbi:unnamed protein product [Zymoseptoria tritici ST99CH_3D1]|nr:unnamed protein product [Zymoseptoria tritici ST99CH_3D1]
MDPIDLTSLPETPPHKKRKVALLVPVLPRMSSSDLLAQFGAHQSPASIRKMDRETAGHRLRGTAAVSYAESPTSTAENSPSKASDFDNTPQPYNNGYNDVRSDSDDSEDELAEDTIHAVPRGTAAPSRELPPRSRRANVSYETVDHTTTKKKSYRKSKNGKRSKTLLTSDTTHPKQVKAETARGKVRADIAAYTKPKRDAFLLANKSYFQPLLPENSYIDKLERINAMAGQDEPEEHPYVNLTEQPKEVTAVMKPYQLEGLSFLVHMYENGVSSILGDEMGLGKTLQTLSLFQYLVENKPTTGEHRPNLVVCPLSVLSSWIAESRKWVPGLNVVRFHGPVNERLRLKQEMLEKKTRFDKTHDPEDRVDLVVTTYETFTAEQMWFKRVFVWRYCVLDEGHKIKNEKSDISSALHGLSAEYRLLLTGTPLQNNLKEMWALLHWLFPEVFTIDTADEFRKAFDLTKGTVSTTFMDDARRLLELIMIRRMKNTPGVNLDLPEKEEVVLFVPLTPMQRFWYTRLLTKDNGTLDDVFIDAKAKEEQALKQEQNDEQMLLLEKANAALGKAEDMDTSDIWAESKAIMQEALQVEEEPDTQKKNAWQKLMNLLMQLRKVCIHPYMVPHAAPPMYDIGNHIMNASAKFIVLDKMLEELVVKQKKKVLIFSGFTRALDLVEELLHLKGANSHDAPFRHARLDGSTARAQRNLSIRMFNDMRSDCNVMLLSTRAGGLGINLTSANDVIFIDDDWNPQVTLQAEARAHRIGQKNKVTVYKLCTQGTVEEQMQGRIRKKLYLSAKITESMRNLHSENNADKKRKRRSPNNAVANDDDAPHLDTASLQSLIRRGAQTLARPQIEVSELLNWDWATTLQKCKDQPFDTTAAPTSTTDIETPAVDEQTWLSSMEKVQTAIFDGKRHQKALQAAAALPTDLTRADRRVGKNTTVEIDGFMIDKNSLLCAHWEAVPTLAGKDPRLASPKREKREPIIHQEFCQSCWVGPDSKRGELLDCTRCPRIIHQHCIPEGSLTGGISKNWTFTCTQHACRDCGAKTSDAGGVIFRCRWCEAGYCEDCLDWDKANLVGHELPEFGLLNFGRVTQAFYIECHGCVGRWEVDPADKREVEMQKERIEELWDEAVAERERAAAMDGVQMLGGAGAELATPGTVSEAVTPIGGGSVIDLTGEEMMKGSGKKKKTPKSSGKAMPKSGAKATPRGGKKMKF